MFGLQGCIEEGKGRLAELDREKEARHREVEAPVEAERACLLQEARREAERIIQEANERVGPQEWWLSFGAEKVASLQAQVREAEAGLKEVNGQVEEGQAALRSIHELGEALLEPLGKKAAELARQKGVPYLACLSCPGYQWVRACSGPWGLR